MGLIIKKNKQDLFQLTSSISGEMLHEDEYITENESKKILVNTELWKFLKKVIEINMEFPKGYYINGKSIPTDNQFNQFIIDALKSEDAEDIIFSKFIEAQKDLNLDFSIIFPPIDSADEKDD